MSPLPEISSVLLAHRYTLLIPIAIIEGPILMIVCGFFWRLGYYEFLPMFLLLVIGDLIGDIFWYLIGRTWGHGFIERFGTFFSITESNVNRAKSLFHRYHERILLLSKLTMGFGLAIVTLMTAGMVKIPFRKYMVINTIGQFFWTGFLLSIGYFFGDFYTSIDRGFRLISVIGFGALLIFALYGFAKYVRGRVFNT